MGAVVEFDDEKGDEDADGEEGEPGEGCAEGSVLAESEEAEEGFQAAERGGEFRRVGVGWRRGVRLVEQRRGVRGGRIQRRRRRHCLIAVVRADGAQ